uniref:YdcF family protein n=1 Tax=Thaumasiovibrio occultus TaxID=1891184 RepID=UPI000B356E50|nr:YdcF family protein [Thaumasiovibrio occultus]
MKKGIFGVLLMISVVLGATMKEIYRYSTLTANEPADVAIVLGAAVTNSRPSPVFEERIRHAIDLHAQGRVRKLVFTGGVGAGDTLSEAEAAKAYAIRHGVPAGDILTESQSTITLENFIYADQLISEAGYSSALVVSDPLHMKRAMLMAEQVGLNAKPSPTPTTRFRGWYVQARMLLSESTLLLKYQFEVVLNESKAQDNASPAA